MVDSPEEQEGRDNREATMECEEEGKTEGGRNTYLGKRQCQVSKLKTR